jgi:4'-phosphopantetheinyl transferase EntD
MDADTIARLFPGRVSVCVASREMYGKALFCEEDALVVRACAKRREEFSAGRCAGRAALACLGVPPVAILQGRRGEPLWPSGFVGSITHCDRFVDELRV